MTRVRWPAALATVLFAALAAITAWYWSDGHRFITDAVARGDRRLLANLLRGAGPFTLQDYLAEADRIVRALQWALGALIAVLAAGYAGDRVTAGLYDAIVRAAAPDRARRRVVPILAAAAVFGLLAWTASEVLQRFPNSGDEYCYLYQAETFVHGRVVNAPHPLQEFFGFYHVRQVGDRLFSVFPPGWPAVLTAALAAGVPTWLVNPILGVALLWLTFLVGRQASTARAAAVATVIVAMSPFFVFTSASYFAHTWCAVLLLASAYAGVRAIDERRVAWAAAAGVALGLALLTRNYTAVWAAVPFALALVRLGRFGGKALAACATAGVPFVLLALWYNSATMGAPFAVAMGGGFESYDSSWFPRGWIGRGLEITAGQLANLVGWTPPALLGLYAWAWRGRELRPSARFVSAIFPALVIGYYFYIDRGGNRYGPRYYFEALPFLAMAVAGRVMAGERFADKPAGGRMAFNLLAASLVLCVPMLAWHARAESQVVTERSEPYRLAAAQVSGPAVVFVATDAGSTRPMLARDLTRNDPDWANPVLWAHDRGPDNARLLQRYPGRPAWRYVFDRQARTGRLEAVVVPWPQGP